MDPRTEPPRKPLPPYLEFWARMSVEDLGAWAGESASRWAQARWFGGCLIQLGYPAFPSRN